MEEENKNDEVPVLNSSDFLTASELVSLRKGNDDQFQCIVGQKFYNRSRTWLEDEALKCVLESHKETLNQKRAARICDLIEAEWNKDLNVAVTTKLKGKFVHHMGQHVDGKIFLSPEECIFLLENRVIEIKNGSIPLSTEEAYSVILKKHMSVEKFQVYSYLMKLGFIVVRHQEKSVIDSEKRQNVGKSRGKKREASNTTSEGSKKQRLTFSGALSNDVELHTSPKHSAKSTDPGDNCQVFEIDQTNPLDGATECNGIVSSTSCAATQNSQGELQSCDDVGNNVDISNLPESTVDNDSTEICMLEKQESTMNTRDLASEAENDSIKDVNVEDIDSQSVDSSSNVKRSEENSVGNNDCTTVVLHNTQNLNHLAVNDVTLNDLDKSTADDEIEILVGERSEEVFSCESDTEDSNVTDDTSQTEQLDDDDDITLLEVTKKETKPLAVIDLLSEEEHDETAASDEDAESDDDIQVVKVCNSSNRDQSSKRNLNSQRHFECKKEAKFNSQELSEKISNSSVQFPDLFKKDVACLQRPSPCLLPNHVQPAKEAYVISFQQAQQPQSRLWNSYKEMEDYQRSRRRSRGSGPSYEQFHENRPYSQNMGQHYDTFRGQIQNQSFDNQNQSSSMEQREYDNHLLPRDHHSNRNSGLVDNLFHGRPLLTNTRMSMDFVPSLHNWPPRRNDIMEAVHRTAYTVATSMISSLFNQNVNQNSFPEYPNYSQDRPITNGSGFPQRHENFLSRNMEQHFPRNVMRDNLSANEFPPDYPFSRQRNEGQNFSMSHRNNRRNRYFRHRNSWDNPFPCRYRRLPNKKSWNEVKAVVENQNERVEAESSDIIEVPININQVLWSNNIEPLVKPGTQYDILDVLKKLKITQMANLLDKNSKSERYLPNATHLEISFDVYLPGTKLKKSSPGIPKYRIVVVSATDPVPKYSEIVLLQRKWNDGALLQIAVVDNGDISFYSFNSITLQEVTPHEALFAK